MHILATFATLCCQTRWPRNHSCTTQEHVSFFRTFSGTRQKPTGHFRTFSEISTFSSFSSKSSNLQISVRKSENKKIYVRACSQKVFTILHMSKKICACKFTNVQMCKCVKCKSANVQKTVVHKMRKSAAQIFFQMQKSQICTVHKNTNATFCACHNFVCATNFLCACRNLFGKRFIKNNIHN